MFTRTYVDSVTFEIYYVIYLFKYMSYTWIFKFRKENNKYVFGLRYGVGYNMADIKRFFSLTRR